MDATSVTPTSPRASPDATVDGLSRDLQQLVIAQPVEGGGQSSVNNLSRDLQQRLVLTEGHNNPTEPLERRTEMDFSTAASSSSSSATATLLPPSPSFSAITTAPATMPPDRRRSTEDRIAHRRPLAPDTSPYERRRRRLLLALIHRPDEFRALAMCLATSPWLARPQREEEESVTRDPLLTEQEACAWRWTRDNRSGVATMERAHERRRGGMEGRRREALEGLRREHRRRVEEERREQQRARHMERSSNTGAAGWTGS